MIIGFIPVRSAGHKTCPKSTFTFQRSLPSEQDDGLSATILNVIGVASRSTNYIRLLILQDGNGVNRLTMSVVRPDGVHCNYLYGNISFPWFIMEWYDLYNVFSIFDDKTRTFLLISPGSDNSNQPPFIKFTWISVPTYFQVSGQITMLPLVWQQIAVTNNGPSDIWQYDAKQRLLLQYPHWGAMRFLNIDFLGHTISVNSTPDLGVGLIQDFSPFYHLEQNMRYGLDWDYELNKINYTAKESLIKTKFPFIYSPWESFYTMSDGFYDVVLSGATYTQIYSQIPGMSFFIAPDYSFLIIVSQQGFAFVNFTLPFLLPVFGLVNQNGLVYLSESDLNASPVRSSTRVIDLSDIIKKMMPHTQSNSRICSPPPPSAVPLVNFSRPVSILGAYKS